MIEEDVTQERFVSYLKSNVVGGFAKIIYTDWDTGEIYMESGLLQEVNTEEEDWGESVYLLFEDKAHKRLEGFNGIPLELASDFVIYSGDDENVCCYGDFSLPNTEFNICHNKEDVPDCTKEYVKQSIRRAVYEDSCREVLGSDFSALDSNLFELIGQHVTLAIVGNSAEQTPYTVSLCLTGYDVKSHALYGKSPDNKDRRLFLSTGLDYIIMAYEPIKIIGYTKEAGYWKARVNDYLDYYK